MSTVLPPDTLAGNPARSARAGRRAIARILLAFASAGLLVASMPGFGAGWLAWVALLPLLFALRDARPLAGFGLAYLTGFGFLLGSFYWIRVASGVHFGDYLLLGAFFALYIGAFGGVFCLLRESLRVPVVVSAPVAWIALEFARAHSGFMGLPMNLLAHSQYLNVPLVQLAGVLGEAGVSFILVMANALLLELVTRQARAPLMVACAAILSLVFAYGVFVVDQYPIRRTVAVTVIQPNIPQELKWKRELQDQHLQQHVRLSREANSRRRTAQLIVWPESSLPGYLFQDVRSQGLVTALAKELDTHLLVGSAQRPKFGQPEFRAAHSLNAAYLVAPSGKLTNAYHKARLIPFVEYLPFEHSVPWPTRWAAGADHFIPGADNAPFPLGLGRFVPVICWESIFAGYVGGLVRAGADFVVNIGNEAWFGDTVASYQFLAANVFRAVENRVPIARSVNTGISGFIDPYGRILDTVGTGGNELFVEGSSTMDLPVIEHRPPFARYGNLFVYADVAVALVLIAVAVARRMRRGREGGS